jgi:hypothetical protein
MWKSKTVWVLAFALAIGALAAGCGGDDTDPKQDYIAKADEICRLGSLQIASEGQRRYGGSQPPPGKLEEYAKQIVVPVLQKSTLRGLRALPPPEGDEETVAAIYDALRETIAALRANPALIAQPNVGGAFDEVNRLARDYGFGQCGSN